MALTNNSKHSIILDGKKTSVSLEEPFWQGFREIAKDKGVTVGALVETIDAKRKAVGGNLSSVIRVFVFEYFKGLVPPPSPPDAA